MEALDNSENPEEFDKVVRKLTTEGIHNLAEQLPEMKKKSPSVYFKVVKAFIRSRKEVKIVKAFLEGEDIVSIEEGTERMIKTLFQKPRAKNDGIITKTIADIRLVK